MLSHFDKTFTGRLHCGEDDVKNLHELVKAMKERDILQVTHKSTEDYDGTFPEITTQAGNNNNIGGGEISPEIKKRLDECPLPRKQLYDYFVVLDFEATCLQGMKIRPQEIIEFPCQKVDSSTFEAKDGWMFHSYVKPVHRARLSPYCIKLTNISQATVQRSPKFIEVWNKFIAWMDEQGLDSNGENFIFVTCGDWDLQTMLPEQANLVPEIGQLPECFRRWINIKDVFSEVTGIKLVKSENDLMQMLKALDIDHEGKLHSGKDDVKNITNVLRTLARMTTLEKTSP